MHFAFSDEQLALRDAVRDLLAKECPPAAVRAAWSSPSGRCPSAWAALTEMGVLGVVAPEALGGLGLDEVDLVLVLEETGRFALPEPIVETAAVAVPLLAERGDSRAEKLVNGASAAVVHALAPYAVWADTAECIIVLGDGQLAVVGSADLPLRSAPSVDGARRLFAVDLTASLPSGTAPPDTNVNVDLAIDRAALGTAAQLVGLADRMISMTVEYATARHQFGVPIGSFQAVKHKFTDMLVALERARATCYFAALTI
ncbi:MAG: hypothetical protein QOH10_336, partial [Actinomycetota bacterium]|nr:hypothetical protein [Actinomycetota bacterium]